MITIIDYSRISEFVEKNETRTLQIKTFMQQRTDKLKETDSFI